MVKFRGKKRGKSEIGKAILASSVTAMVMITALNVLTGREDPINALTTAIKAIPFVVLWTFLLISLFDRGLLFEGDEESQEDLLDSESFI